MTTADAGPPSGPPPGAGAFGAGAFEDGAPVPPPGPGVTPPFPAPPTDRNRRGLWIGLGLGALALVVCCAGGLFGFGVIVVNGTDQVKRQARDVVGGYFDALIDRDYERAYELLCPALTGQTSEEQFSTRQEGGPHPVRYTLGQTELGNAIIVPAYVSYDEGGSRQRRVRLEQVRSTGELKVCGGTD
jgi:hypothetical protein